MRFIAFDLSLGLLRELRPLLARLRTRHPGLHRQLRGAATSVPLNLAEGAGRAGADRRHHYRVALGSLMEAKAAVLSGEALGDLTAAEIEPVLPTIERLERLLWGLSR